MSSRHAFAIAASVVAALLCTTAFAQSEQAAASTSSGAAVTTSAAAPAPAASVASIKPAKLMPGDAKAGQTKAAVCAACHGMDGNSTDPQYPRLAGQSEHYIANQLASFKSGQRANPIMLGFASSLSPQDMRDVGAYFASQKPQAGVADEKLVRPGQALYRGGNAKQDIPACMACHGPAGSGNPGAPYPHLAGQHADYVQKVLKAWHDGDTWGDTAHAQIMPAIAKRLSEQDIVALSSYIEGLHAVQQ
ncbi:MAG: c-type cytochrome [Rhodanobacteraceae bacterium]